MLASTMDPNGLFCQAHPYTAQFYTEWAWLVAKMVKKKKKKKSIGNAGDVVSISGSGTCPGEGNGISLQYSCPGNPLWVTKSWND